MKVLLDTHAFVAAALDEKLPPAVRRLLAKQSTEVLISIVTPWEIGIKNSCPGPKKGKPVGFTRRHIEHAIAAMGALLVPVTLDHTETATGLPLHHTDPFDRMIIAQALEAKCPVVSSDTRFPEYKSEGLDVIW